MKRVVVAILSLFVLICIGTISTNAIAEGIQLKLDKVFIKPLKADRICINEELTPVNQRLCDCLKKNSDYMGCIENQGQEDSRLILAPINNKGV